MTSFKMEKYKLINNKNITRLTHWSRVEMGHLNIIIYRDNRPNN